MDQKTWMVQRAVIAVCFLVGFYVLGLSVAVGLLWIPYAEWTYAGTIHIKVLAVCVGAAFAILWALVPRVDKFTPPGPTLDRASHPDLFHLIGDVARGTQQAMPAEVYLLNEVNAWVTHRGGIMGFGSRRVMGIGLPLLQALSVPELKAVIAHEFGHYHSGDVALGPWLYKTRAAIGRTVVGVRNTWFEALFTWYGRQFLKVTHALSRRQEFLADAIAAQLCGADAMARALRRTATVGPVFSLYARDEVIPVLRAGFLPPVVTGFDAFLQDERVAVISQQIVSAAESETAANPFDTHPTLRERLDALHSTGAPATTRETPAVNLIGNAEHLGVRVVEHALGNEASKLTPISWQQVGDLVHAANWRYATKQYGDWLSRFTVDALPVGKFAFINAGADLVHPDEENVNDDERIGRATYLFGAAISALLLDRGWRADTAPGKPVVLVSNGATVDPFSVVKEMADGSISAEHWTQRCTALGIAGHRLGRSES